MAGGGVDKSSDSVVDGLKKLFSQVSELKLLPDAPQHMEAITALEQAIMQYIQQTTARAQAEAMQAAQSSAQQAAGIGAGAGMADMTGGAPPGMGGPPGMAPGQPQQIAPGGGAGMSGFGSPTNPDELRRVLQMSGAGGG